MVANRLKILDKVFLRGPSFSQMLYEVTSSLPENIQLTLLDFQETGKVFIKGYADDIGSVFSAIEVLNDSELFSGMKIKYASQVKRKGRVRIEFYIQGKRRL